MTSIFTTPVFIGLLAGIAALPVLIHLINMLRHRRVKWAAMEFLLHSYKKNRNWIVLKQLLLLVMRMAALILLLLMLAQVGCDETKGKTAAEDAPAHHYVLLDDSFSMADRAGDMTVFDRARKSIDQIVQWAGSKKAQRFTLLRFSRAAGNTTSMSADLSVDALADVNSQLVDTQFNALLEMKRATIDISELVTGPLAALNMVRQLLESREGENAIIYLLSDFRAKDWDKAEEVKGQLKELQDLGAKLVFIDCAQSERQNLAIVGMKPDEEARSAGVTFFMNVAVKNFGPDTQHNIPVSFHKIFYDPNDELAGDPMQVRGRRQTLPPEVVDEIKPGETVWRRTQVDFPKGGHHVVEASLPDDALAVDNRWRTVVELFDGVPVLVVHGRDSRRAAYYLASAFDPGENVTAGVRPIVKSEEFLRDVQPEELDTFHAIYLADVARPDPRAVSNLEKFVTNGGGVGIFVGPSVDIQYYNDKLYREGKGLFPLPLDPKAGVAILPEEATKNLPDILPTEHPAFAIYLDERDTFLNQITLNRYLKPPKNWSEANDDSVQVAAYLRNRDPLAVQRRFGQGRVVTILTTATPDWSDWQGNATFVITLLKLQAQLASGREQNFSSIVGSDMDVQINPARHQTDVVFVTPGEESLTAEDGEEVFAAERITIERQAVALAGEQDQLVATLGGQDRGLGLRSIGDTNRQGVYEAWLFTKDNEPDVRRFALNVDTAESNLTLITTEGLLTRLSDVNPAYTLWNEFTPKSVGRDPFPLGHFLLILLICLLIGEQIMAYAISYHPARRAGTQTHDIAYARGRVR